MQVMGELIRSNIACGSDALRLDENVRFFEDTVGACERIYGTPIPVSYTRHTSRFLSIWASFIPVGLFSEVQWAALLFAPALTFLLFAIDGAHNTAQRPRRGGAPRAPGACAGRVPPTTICGGPFCLRRDRRPAGGAVRGAAAVADMRQDSGQHAGDRGARSALPRPGGGPGSALVSGWAFLAPVAHRRQPYKLNLNEEKKLSSTPREMSQRLRPHAFYPTLSLLSLGG